MPGSADRERRLQILEHYYVNNLQQRHENGDIDTDFVEIQLLKFYKDQGRTIKNFKKTANTRREDIKTAMENLGVLAI